MFITRDKELRKMLYGVHSGIPAPMGTGKFIILTDLEGRETKIEQTDGIVFYLLDEIRSLKNKVAALEMSRTSQPQNKK